MSKVSVQTLKKRLGSKGLCFLHAIGIRWEKIILSAICWTVSAWTPTHGRIEYRQAKIRITSIFMWCHSDSCVSQFLGAFAKFLDLEMFQINFVEKTKTHILCSITFFRKLCGLWDNGEKCDGARVVAHDNMAAMHAGLVRLQARKHSLASVHPQQNARTHKCTILAAFPRQQWFRQRASLLRYTYIACIVLILTLEPAAMVWNYTWTLPKLRTFWSLVISRPSRPTLESIQPSLIWVRVFHLPPSLGTNWAVHLLPFLWPSLYVSGWPLSLTFTNNRANDRWRFAKFCGSVDTSATLYKVDIIYCKKYIYTRWFKYDRDKCGLFTHKSVPVIFEPPCTWIDGQMYR
jgi:hypothetical protein